MFSWNILNTLREANVRRQKEWDIKNEISLAYRGNELAGELGETLVVCNTIKKLERGRLDIRGTRATIDQLAAELADVVICVDLIAAATGIDMTRAIIDKFNATSAKYGLSIGILNSGEVFQHGKELDDANERIEPIQDGSL